ncbi:MAG TPA: PEP-CTERM system histidine kinase PrsK [Rubrivivax sp.]|nr:PEP-CTERM system histidine kinase PrsK [Rubrivivax sp.]
MRPTFDLTFISLAIAAAAYAFLAVWTLGGPRDAVVRAGRAWLMFVLATGATVGWATLGATDRLVGSFMPAHLAALLDGVRQLLWCLLLLTLLQPDQGGRRWGREWRPLLLATVLVSAAALAVWLARTAQGALSAETWWPSLAVSLAFAVLGLVLVEQLFRNLPEDSRWSAKPLCLALGLGFGYDLYLYSEAVLLGRLDPDGLIARGAVAVIAVPLLISATRGRSGWMRRIQVSRSVAFHSATLVLVGVYLLFMAGVGYYVRYFGGEWGRALQLAMVTGAVVALVAIMLSGSLRARLKVFVSKNFFSYRYDYREEWLKFTRTLASSHAPQEVGTLIVKGLSSLVETPGGDLWTTDGAGEEFRQTARWNVPAIALREPVQAPFGAFLKGKGWVIDMHEYRNAPRRYGDLVLPTWLLARGEAWLVVPLAVGDELLGFVTLDRPRTTIELDWEVRDLLKTAAQQAAGYLAQMRATEALLEARKFDAFNRMSAFVVHDLKNIVTQLSLMMKNAQRLHANPEFQQDMLLTVESSLEKMRRLMLQLREGATPPGSAHGVEVAAVLHQLDLMARGRGRLLEVSCEEGLFTRGHEDRLERVLGHLVQNAFDATPADGRVWIAARRHSGLVQVEVGDTGTGMDEDFVRNRLFRPFGSTKHDGMGIGSYESHQYIRELGGAIDVQSRPGSGTVMRITLPLFSQSLGAEAQSASTA